MFVLIQWIGGADEGKISVLPIECIRNFDEDLFALGMDSDSDSVYVVEWRGRSGRRPGGVL